MHDKSCINLLGLRSCSNLKPKVFFFSFSFSYEFMTVGKLFWLGQACKEEKKKKIIDLKDTTNTTAFFCCIFYFYSLRPLLFYCIFFFFFFEFFISFFSSFLQFLFFSSFSSSFLYQSTLIIITLHLSPLLSTSPNTTLFYPSLESFASSSSFHQYRVTPTIQRYLSN